MLLFYILFTLCSTKHTALQIIEFKTISISQQAVREVGHQDGQQEETAYSKEIADW